MDLSDWVKFNSESIDFGLECWVGEMLKNWRPLKEECTVCGNGMERPDDMFGCIKLGIAANWQQWLPKSCKCCNSHRCSSTLPNKPPWVIEINCNVNISEMMWFMLWTCGLCYAVVGSWIAATAAFQVVPTDLVFPSEDRSSWFNRNIVTSGMITQCRDTEDQILYLWGAWKR